MQMRYVNKPITDRSRPALPTTASGVAQESICGNYTTAGLSENKRRRRGERRVKTQRRMWKGRRSLIRFVTLNIGTMTGRRERAGRHDGAKECRYTVSTGSKVERE